MRGQRGRGAIGEMVGGPAVQGGELLQEDAGEVQDVVRALAERRHVQADDVQAVEEVLAELPLGDPGRGGPRWWRR